MKTLWSEMHGTTNHQPMRVSGPTASGGFFERRSRLARSLTLAAMSLGYAVVQLDVTIDEAKTVGVKALVLTGHGPSVKPGERAPYDYLLKPLRVSEIVAAIERTLAAQKSWSPASLYRV